jgi:hypothetical protein
MEEDTCQFCDKRGILAKLSEYQGKNMCASCLRAWRDGNEMGWKEGNKVGYKDGATAISNDIRAQEKKMGITVKELIRLYMAGKLKRAK